MTHEACQERLLELAYGELAPSEAAEVEAHLQGCESCRAAHARLEGTRLVMRRLEPEPPPVHGEHPVLTAAREAVEHRRAPRRFWSSWVFSKAGTTRERWFWVYRWSLTATALVVVGTVSYRVLSFQKSETARDLAGRSATFAESSEHTPPTAASAPAPVAAPAKNKKEVARPRAERPPTERGLATPPNAEKGSSVRGLGTPPVAESEFTAPKQESPPDSARGLVPSRRETEEPRPKKMAPPSRLPLALRPADSGQAPPPLEADSVAKRAPAQRVEEDRSAEQSEAAAAPAGPLLSEKTWSRDRRIRAIQTRVREIDDAQRKRRLTETARPLQACGAGEDAQRRLYALEGRTVKYVRQVGGGEVALTIEQYYDIEERLRYVFIHGGAVNGAVVEHRLWLDPSGQRLWEQQRWRRGHYPLPAVWPEEDLALNAPDASALECGSP